MLDLTGFPALDLAIALAFLFFLLSTGAAMIQEFIASCFGLRARTLEQGLRSMLEDPEKGWKYVDDFYEHPLITSLYRTPPPRVVETAKKGVQPSKADEPKPSPEAEADPVGKRAHTQSRGALHRALAFFKPTKGPSYISPRAFALVVLDNVTRKPGETTALDKGVDALPGGLQQRLTPLVTEVDRDVAQLRTGLEAWYDDTMARVSGWYKRKTQIILLVIGVALVLAVNANAISIGQRLWKDDTVRSAVVAQAQAQAAAAARSGDSKQQLETAADNIDQVKKVGIPLGWRGDAVPRGKDAIKIAVGGWLLTILAISLGAPFWFDALGRLSRLRSSGKPETPLPATGSGKANERILTPPQAPPGS